MPALNLPPEFFDDCYAEPHMILRMSRYPVLDTGDDTLASLVPHTDSGFMTLLPPNPVPGLSILLPDPSRPPDTPIRPRRCREN
jgi:isopenicillin N synthase-like dioxygenase